MIKNAEKKQKSTSKTELILSVSETSGLSKADSTRALEAIMQSIQNELKKHNDVSLSGFGTFSISQREARKGRNPQTGEAISIPAKKHLKFKAGKTLKEALA